MSDPFYGEIRMFAGNFAPRHWAFCMGGLVSIAQNNALFSLLGTTYGGDGRTTFALPDLRGRIPLHQGTGVGLTPRLIGQRFGDESVILSGNEMPAHTHSLNASNNDGNSASPGGRVLGSQSDGDLVYTELSQDPTRIEQMTSVTVELSGGNLPHNNMMSFLCLSFIICLLGDYPSRN